MKKSILVGFVAAFTLTGVANAANTGVAGSAINSAKATAGAQSGVIKANAQSILAANGVQTTDSLANERERERERERESNPSPKH